MFAIAPYLVQVLDEQKQPLNLWDFYNKNSLKDFLDGYYGAQLNQHVTTDVEKKSFLVKKKCVGSSASVAGVYETGEFGFKSRIYSTTKKTTTHARERDEADMHPFYFSYYLMEKVVPAQKVRALLLLSRFKTAGIRGMTIPHVQENFRKQFPGLTLDVKRMLPNSVLEGLMKSGSLKTIRLIKNTLPKDLADKFTVGDNSKIREVELVIQTKKNMVFSEVQWIWDAIKNKKQPNEIISFDSFVPTNIKLDIKIGEKTRVLDIMNPGRLSSNIDVSDLDVDLDGHPKLDEWITRADELAGEIADSWGMPKMKWLTSPI
jgi:hypothetical protein